MTTLSESPRSALVIDDDPSIRNLVATILQREDFEVDLARDGSEALELLGARKYGLVLLDLMMPRVNGYEVLAHLQENDPDTVNHVVVMTATSDADLAKLDQTGLCGLIRKPFDLEDFRAYITDCYEKVTGSNESS
ncbi:MAG TPA: response regulator [Thermoanaerobaculia bacterium]|nr:response regulator [Thermoanaerobaculia bacterium]